MELKSYDSQSKSSTCDSRTSHNNVPKKAIKKSQKSYNEKERFSNVECPEKPVVKNEKRNVFQKKTPVPTNVPGRKENKPIETIGNDRFKNLLSTFDKSLKVSDENNQNTSLQKKPEDLKGVNIKERMQNYLNNCKERQIIKSSYDDPVLSMLKGTSESQDIYENPFEEEEDNTSDLSGEEIRESSEDKRDNYTHEEVCKQSTNKEAIQVDVEKQ